MLSTHRCTLTILLIALAGLACACSDFAARLRRHTYPPGFQYITREQLDSSMWQLAHAVQGLRTALREAPIDEARRAEISQLLAAMEVATKDLSAHGWPTNHPLVDANIDALHADIAQARRSVEGNPPNYVLAGAVSGACIYCH